MRRLLPLLALIACAWPAAAHARSADLWATVNVCDSQAFPNIIGVRASMPGNGTSQRLYMRFEAQWYSKSKGRFVPTGSSSRWLKVGSARYKSTQAGFSFQFEDPPEGTAFLMRGKVDFQWRVRRKRRWVVVRQRSRTTAAGMSRVEGGDPKGRSDAICVINH